MILATCGGPFRPAGRGLRIYCGLTVLTTCEVASRSTHCPFGAYLGWTPLALAETARLISRGKLHIPVEKSYTLTEAAAAHIDSQAGHARGRRVIAV